MQKCTFAFLMISLILLFVTPALAAELRLPSNLREIEAEAFAGDTSLDQVILPEGTLRIGDRAFANSSLKSITLPDSLTYIADNAFQGCTGVRAIVNNGTPAYSYALSHGMISNTPTPQPTATAALDPKPTATGTDVDALTITSHPTAKAVIEGGSVTFSVSASDGTGNYTYQWYRASSESGSGSTISGATSKDYTFIASREDDGTYYYCVVTSGTETAVSDRGLLTVIYIIPPDTVPGVPQNISAYVDADTSQVIVEWEPVEYAAGYNVYDFFDELAETIQGKNNTKYVYSNYTGNTVVVVLTVKAYNANGIEGEGGTILDQISGAPIIFKVQYNANGGTGILEIPEIVDKGEAITLSNEIPTRDGFSFQGWATSSTATSAQYSPGDRFIVDCDVTFYAVWKENSSTLSISENPVDATVMEDETVTFSVTAEGGTGDYSYQWYVASSATGTGSKISKATKRTYSFTATLDDDGDYYYCEITCGSEKKVSNRAKVYVDEAVVEVHVNPHAYTNITVENAFSVSELKLQQGQTKSVKIRGSVPSGLTIAAVTVNGATPSNDKLGTVYTNHDWGSASQFEETITIDATSGGKFYTPGTYTLNLWLRDSNTPQVVNPVATMKVIVEKAEPLATKTSQAGINFIKNWEGCKLYVYDDGEGNPTIGWGHRIKDGENFTTITQEEADALFLSDLLEHEARANAFIKNTGITPNQQHYDALSSFFYNGNAGAQTSTTSFYKMFANNKSNLSGIDEKEVYRRFAAYCDPGSSTQTGEFKRRCDEARIFLEGVYERRNWTIPTWVKNGQALDETWYPVEINSEPNPYGMFSEPQITLSQGETATFTVSGGVENSTNFVYTVNGKRPDGKGLGMDDDWSGIIVSGKSTFSNTLTIDARSGGAFNTPGTYSLQLLIRDASTDEATKAATMTVVVDSVNSVKYTSSETDGFVIVRESASNSAKKLFILPHNTSVTILSDQGNWSNIQTNDGRVGYISNTVLSTSPQTNVLLILNQREFDGDEDFFNPNTIKKQGCGLVAAINAVYYKTGNLIDIYAARDYMKAQKCFTAGDGNTDPTKFFRNYLAQFGVTYVAHHQTTDVNWGDKTTSTFLESVSTKLKENMKKGHWFIACLGDQDHEDRAHYVAIVAYNANTEEYLILDSDGDGTAWTGARSSWQKLTFDETLGSKEPKGRYKLSKTSSIFVYELWEFQ